MAARSGVNRLPACASARHDISWGIAKSISRKCLGARPELRAIPACRPSGRRPAPGCWKTGRCGMPPSSEPRGAKAAEIYPPASAFGFLKYGRGASCRGLVGCRHCTRGRPQPIGRHTHAQGDQVRRSITAGVQQAHCLINTRLDLQDNLREGIAAWRERTLAIFGSPGRPGVGPAGRLDEDRPS